VSEKYTKMKTEQKYREDNYNLMRRSRRNRGSRPREGESPDHPFVALLEEEEKRRKQTRSNFIVQNQLNELQSQMKRSMIKQKKEQSEVESRNYVNFVEAEFEKQLKERMMFEQKYLRLDSNYSRLNTNSNLGNISETLPGRRVSRKEEMSIDRGRYSRERNPEHDLSLQKQYDMKIGAKRQTFAKAVTERASDEVDTRLVTDRAQSSLTSSCNPVKYRAMEESSRPRREYRHYDIIQNSEKTFFQ
jgi:hypothetical protein